MKRRGERITLLLPEPERTNPSATLSVRGQVRLDSGGGWLAHV